MHFRSTVFPLACAPLLLLGLPLPLPGAEPVLKALFPAGGQQGTEFVVTADGKFDPWPVQVWSSDAGLNWQATEKPGQFKVRVDAAARPGPRWVRCYNASGASDLRLFVVGRLAETEEKEPNNEHGAAPTTGPLPITINGRFEKSEDVDCYALDLKAGQWLVAAVDAYGLRSPLDPLLHVFDAGGRRVAFQHDSSNLDPLLGYHVERDGRYLLQLAAFAYPPEANIRFAGSSAAVYRLTLTVGPYPRFAFPTAVHRQQSGTVRICGWNLAGSSSEVQVPPSYESKLDVAPREWPRPLLVDVADQPQMIEIEPNDKDAMKVTTPVWVHGRLDPAGDQDRFAFHARKGDSFHFAVQSLDLGFLADTVLIVEKAGAEVARDDDVGEDRDPSLDWTAPEESDYCVCVRELFGRGGTDFVYRLIAQARLSDFTVSATATAIKLSRGKEAEYKVKVDRFGGHQSTLVVRVEGLPDQVEVKPVEVPAKGGDVTVAFTAPAQAAPFSGPIQVMVSEEGDGRCHAAWVDLREDKLRGDMLLNGTDQLWLTVE